MTDTPSSPFDPAALRLSQDFGAEVGVQKQLTMVPVRKPSRQDFVRVHPEESYRLETTILDLKEDREIYLVAAEMRDALLSEIYPVRLYTAINRRGMLALWPCRLPSIDGRTNPWHETALQAAELAMEKWVKVAANMSLGGYETFIATGDLQDPEWPDYTFEQLLEIAFRNHFIDSPDHPVIKRLRGEM
jgi:hypothetical protein